MWNRFVAAWFEGGKDDPNLVLLRFEAEHAEIWIDASSFVAGIKMLLGVDPKKDYKKKMGEIDLRSTFVQKRSQLLACIGRRQPKSGIYAVLSVPGARVPFLECGQY